MKINNALIITFALVSAMSRAEADDGRQKKCSTVYQTPIAIFIEPSDKKIETMKRENGDDFYTIADDALYYEWQATEFLEKMGFPYCFTENENHEFKIDQSKQYILNEKCYGWCIVLWNGKDRPLLTKAVDIFMHEPYLKRADLKY